MKKLFLVFLIFPCLLSAKGLMDDREVTLVDPSFKNNMNTIIAIIQADNLGPTKELYPKCSEITEYGGGEVCNVNGVSINSCSINFNDEEVLCYNGNAISKTPQNILMMNYLCSDTEFFGPPYGLHLGTCNPDVHKDLLKVEGKVSCDCRSKKDNRHGWVCFDIKPKD